MANNKAPSQIQTGLEKICEKAAKKVSKVAPGEKNEKKLADLLTKEVCKDVDQKILKEIAKQLAELGKKSSAKAPANAPPKVKTVPKFKEPGSGVPSFTIPLYKLDLGDGGKSKGKLQLKVWGDPKELEKSDKGVMLNFTVSF